MAEATGFITGFDGPDAASDLVAEMATARSMAPRWLQAVDGDGPV
jgi:hypothetical protein